MSDLNDDLLNYDIGDVIDDQVLIGADEDELLLSDDDLEKDVSKEEKLKLKSEAEEWVKSQIKDKPKPKPKQVVEKSSVEPHKTCQTEYTKNSVIKVQEHLLDQQQLSVVASSKTQQFKTPADQTNTTSCNEVETNISAQSPTNALEFTSNSFKEMELDQSSILSNSANSITNDSWASSALQSSQESASITMSHGDISDPREDYEEEREERTNIKTTSEREAFEHNNEHSPGKPVNRYVYHQKRNGAPLIRGHLLRFPVPRPLLRFPPHGNISLLSPSPFTHLGALAAVTTHPITNPLIPGQPYPPPTQQSNTNPFAPQPPPNTLQNTPHGPMAGPNHDPHNPHHRPRHPFGFRPGPMTGFRHPNPSGVYSQVPHDFNTIQGQGVFNHHQFGGLRNVFRPEGPMGLPPGMRLGMRMQRPPLQALPPHAMPNQGNYMNAPPHQIRPQTVPGSQPPPGAPTVSGQTPAVANQPPAGQVPANGPSVPPRKVLINPNFKGGVEAATSKFIQETQYMNAINTHVPQVQSDEELLRQQEEFINKNREHIEKRRHARDVSPARRSRSRSRSHSRSRTPRSVSRERSYTPPKRHPNGGPHNRNDRFDRERERGDRDRPSNDDKNARMGRAASRDREDRDRDRNRPIGGYNNNRPGPNRFRRGNSRDRDYENRNQGGSGGNYGKRRRSNSPSPGNRSGGGSFGGNRGRYNNDRDKSEVEEDEETRAYRLQIEKQKALREQIMRDKEMKRRRAAEEKQYEEKRTGGPQQKDDTPPKTTTQHQHQQQQNSQKLKEVVAERKIISLKKRSAEHNDNDDHGRSTQRRAIPTAKILPEAKKTLTDHLQHNTASGERCGGSNSISQNTAIIKPVLKKDSSSSSATVAAIKPQPHHQSHSHRRMSSHSEDEVQLDYDEDDLLLDEEDMLLASPEPTPPRETASKQRLESRTPSPEPNIKSHNVARKPTNPRGSGSSTGGGNHGTSKPSFSSTNRRVVLKTSSNTSGTTATNSSSRGRDMGSSSSSVNSNSRRAIFERLDVRNSRQQSPATAGTSSSGNSDHKRKPQRIVLKHD